MLTPSTSDPASSRPLALTGCYPETRIGAFDFSAATCTELLMYGSADGQRACGDSWRGVTEDLFLFTQEDPAGFAVSLRLYRYAASDPISRTDPGGLWSKKGHDQFISWALSGRVPDFYVTAIQEASARFDGRWGGQMPWNSFMHGMKAPWQSPAEALALRDRFIHEHLGLARCAIQTGDFAGALDHFGIAMHPLMDSFSPAHVGRGDPLSWPLNIPDHSPTEGLGIEAASDITFSMKQKVTWEIWDAYQRVFLR